MSAHPDNDIWIAILVLFMIASGRCVNLPIFRTWKESETVWVQRGIRTGCWDVWTDASWSLSIQCRVQTEKIRRPDGWCWSVWCLVGMNMSSGRMEQWTNGHPNGMTRRPDGWQENWNLLSFSQCRVFWKCWQVESLFTASLHISDFVQTQNEANILTNSPFGHSRSKN